jgi:heme d1 biosynthesis radical SAM protein NirJ
MFRITQYMRELAQAQASGSYPAPSRPGSAPRAEAAGKDSSSQVGRSAAAGRHARGPVVIWNLIRRCNLTCKHCYAQSADHEYAGELSTQEVFSTLVDLKAAGVPALILSGGEPLLRPDFFEIAQRAKELGFHVSLSSNGTLIDEAMADRIAAFGFDYVGISLDGLKATHDKFRRLDGAFDLSLAGVRLLHARGIKVGLRYTMTALNGHDFPALLELMRTEGAQKFYFSHLNYAGRGNIHRGKDAHHLATREAMDLLFDRAWDAAVRGLDEEYVTGNNDSDGPYLLLWLQKRHPELHERFGADLRQRLVAWGGNSSGVNVANIDNLGHVHPDTMWWHHDLGSVRERRFGEIWADTRDPLMAGLKARPRQIGGRCAACRDFDICGGNTRVRAQQLNGDTWGEDPGCYLLDEEIGVAGSAEQPAGASRRVIPLEVHDA